MAHRAVGKCYKTSALIKICRCFVASKEQGAMLHTFLQERDWWRARKHPTAHPYSRRINSISGLRAIKDAHTLTVEQGRRIDNCIESLASTMAPNY